MEKNYRSKDRALTEREKLKNMNFGEKLSYLWEYYRYYIIGGLIAVAVILSLFNTCVSRPNISFTLIWSASHIDTDKIEALTEILDKYIIGDSADESAEVSFSYMITDDTVFMTHYFSRLVAMLSANAIDVFILNAETMQIYSESEYIAPLDNVLSEINASSPQLYDKIMQEAEFTMFGLNEFKRSELAGIRITDTPLLNELGFDTKTDIYFCMAVSSRQIVRVTETLKLFFEEFN